MEEGISFYNEEGITFYENLNVLAKHENIGSIDIFEAYEKYNFSFYAEWYSYDRYDNIFSFTEKQVKIILIEFIIKHMKKKETK